MRITLAMRVDPTRVHNKILLISCIVALFNRYTRWIEPAARHSISSEKWDDAQRDVVSFFFCTCGALLSHVCVPLIQLINWIDFNHSSLPFDTVTSIRLELLNSLFSPTAVRIANRFASEWKQRITNRIQTTIDEWQTMDNGIQLNAALAPQWIRHEMMS